MNTCWEILPTDWKGGTTSADCLPGDLAHLINHLSATPANAANIKDLMANDPLLSNVKRYIMVSWPETQLGEVFQLYRSRWKVLSTLDQCILWGSCVVIPSRDQKAALEELHETCSKKKALAWWPKMDQEVEALVQKCSICQESWSSPPSAPLHTWQWPGQPSIRLHLDFAGPYKGYMFLVIVDAHSKCLDAHIMSSITSEGLLRLLTVRSVGKIPRQDKWHQANGISPNEDTSIPTYHLHFNYTCAY